MKIPLIGGVERGSSRGGGDMESSQGRLVVPSYEWAKMVDLHMVVKMGCFTWGLGGGFAGGLGRALQVGTERRTTLLPIDRGVILSGALDGGGRMAPIPTL